MPDTRQPQRPLHDDWQGAFASLPLETPPAGGWDAVAARLSTRRRRLPAWLAIAAVLALVAILPLRQWWLDTPSQQSASSTAIATAPPATVTDPSADPVLDTQPQTANPAVLARETQTATTGTRDTTVAQPTTETPRPRPDAEPAIAQVADARAATAATPITQPTSDATAALATASDTTASFAAPPSATASELDQLYAESARLEMLLNLARDQHVSSASAVVLGQAYDAQVATIDQALMQPSLSDTQRVSLWRNRVGALRQVATFESTQRVLAAWGQRDDLRLVSID